WMRNASANCPCVPCAPTDMTCCTLPAGGCKLRRVHCPSSICGRPVRPSELLSPTNLVLIPQVLVLQRTNRGRHHLQCRARTVSPCLLIRFSSVRTQRSLLPIFRAASRCIMLPSLAFFSQCNSSRSSW